MDNRALTEATQAQVPQSASCLHQSLDQAQMTQASTLRSQWSIGGAGAADPRAAARSGKQADGDGKAEAIFTQESKRILASIKLAMSMSNLHEPEGSFALQMPVLLHFLLNRTNNQPLRG